MEDKQKTNKGALTECIEYKPLKDNDELKLLKEDGERVCQTECAGGSFRRTMRN